MVEVLPVAARQELRSDTRQAVFPLANVVRWVGGMAEAWRWGGQEVHSNACEVGPWTSDLAAWGPERALILLCGLWGGAVATQGFLGWVKKKHNCCYLLSPPLKSDFHLLSSPKTSQPLANGKG